MLEYLGSSRVVEAPRKAGLAVRPRLFETAYVPLDSGSEVEVAHPAVGFEALHLILGQSPAVAYPHVPLHVSDRAHPRDNGRYGRVAQDVAERDLRHLVLGDAELGDDGPYPLVDLLLAVAAEVVVAEVALLEGGLRRDPPGQGALIKRHPHDDADVVLLTGREQFVLRTLVEDVVDHLHRVHHARLYELYGVLRLVVVYRDAEEADLALPLQVLYRLQPVPLADPLVGPDVELLHVYCLETEVPQARLRALPYVVRRKGLARVQPAGRRPHPVLRRYLRRDVDGLVSLFSDPANEPFAVALSVGEGGVYEVEAEVYGPVQRPERLFVLGAEPLALSDAPRPVADLRDLQSRPAEPPVVHAALPILAIARLMVADRPAPPGGYNAPRRRWRMRILDERHEALVDRERALLGRFIGFLKDFGAPSDDVDLVRRTLSDLEELFLLVIVGEFNSGKSAFINALLGAEIAEEGVTPTTDRITVLRHSPEPVQRERRDGVLEKGYPSALLREIAIVDTPGTNAIIRHHEELSRGFVPRSDLVLFVTSAERPLTESERGYLELIRDWGKKILLVINKADLLAEESKVEEVRSFVAGGIRSALGLTPPIFL